MSLRILFSSRSNFQKQPGGDSIHLEQNAEALRNLGHQVVIWEGESVSKGDFDIIHHFNLGRPAAALKLAKTGIPMVISSIFVDYRAHDSQASLLRRFISQGLGADAMEYLKLVARALKGREAWPPLKYLLLGHNATVQNILQNCSALVCASKAEAQLIEQFYSLPSRVANIKLGVEHLPSAAADERSGILCIARFEPIKNQLHLIEAHREFEEPLSLVGEAAPAHQAYLNQCKKIASEKVQFYPRASFEECAHYYASAKVHVLASHYESTGLVSLEALASGCQIVVNDHPIQRELFGEHAHYCDPNKPRSIRAAIQSALADKRDHCSWVGQEFSWQKSGQRLDELYRDIVSS